MSVENSEAIANSDGLNQQKLVNGSVNGLSNGHSTSSSPEKQHKSSSSSHKSKHRDHDKSKSSSSKDHKSSSSKSSHRDRDDKSKQSSSSHHKSSNRDKDRDKDKEKSSSGSKHHSSSSSNKDKDKSSSKHHSSSNGNGVEKHGSSSSGHRDEKKSSSSSHHRDEKKSTSSSQHTSSRDDKDRKKEHKSSSSSKDKHSSSSGSKHKSKDKDRDRERSSKHHSSSSSSSKRKDEIKKEIKEEEMMEPPQPQCREISIKVEQVDMSMASSCDYSLSQFRDEDTLPVKKEEPEDEEDDDDYETGNTTNNRDFVEVAGGADSDFDNESDVPLSKRKKLDTDSEDEAPLISRKKVKTEKKSQSAKPSKQKKRPSKYDSEDDEDEESGNDSEESDFSQPKKKAKKEIKKEVKSVSKPKPSSKNVAPTPSPKKGGRKKKEEEEEEVWKWWEEEKLEDGTKWKFLEHKGPLFAPPYETLPKSVTFEYGGKKMTLSQDAEEIAGFYSKMLDHDYTSKQVFNDNFFKDWRKSMTKDEQKVITDLSKCNFRNMQKYFAEVSEKNKSRSKEQKKQLKEDNEAIIKEFGFCTIDGHKEKIGNFRIEPPGLFRGRGEHPKMGKVKKRIEANDVIINCSKDSKIPVPPKGSKWKEVRHDNTVTWLVSWQENVQGGVKYIMLNPSSKLKGEKDFHKYEVARKLQKSIGKIRATYTDEWKSKEMRIRQRAVALYFIDKLALRAGNEKDEDQADTVGCCSLRVEHISLHKTLGKMDNVVVFDFLGKDSIRYYNEVEVEKRVFKNLELFKEGKHTGDDLFDRLNTTVLNEHLKELMDGLSAKVFRTYNASITLQTQLDELTDPKSSVPEKLLSYNRANRAVAILCNHQRAVPKQHDKSMENLKEKIKAKQEAIDEVQKELKALKKSSARDAGVHSKKTTQLQRLKEQLNKLTIQETDKDENKTIALGTSKLNYLDPRISVAWCKKHGVPIEKIFNKTQRDKFRWAIEMVDETYVF